MYTLKLSEKKGRVIIGTTLRFFLTSARSGLSIAHDLGMGMLDSWPGKHVQQARLDVIAVDVTELEGQGPVLKELGTVQELVSDLLDLSVTRRETYSHLRLRNVNIHII